MTTHACVLYISGSDVLADDSLASFSKWFYDAVEQGSVGAVAQSLREGKSVLQIAEEMPHGARLVVQDIRNDCCNNPSFANEGGMANFQHWVPGYLQRINDDDYQILDVRALQVQGEGLKHAELENEIPLYIKLPSCKRLHPHMPPELFTQICKEVPRSPPHPPHPTHCRPAFRLHVPSHFHHQPTKRANHLVTHSDGHQRQQP